MAKHSKIRPAMLARYFQEIQALGHGNKTAHAQKIANFHAISVSKLYRHFADSGLTDRALKKREPGIPEYREWVTIIMALALKTRNGKPVPLIDARAAAVEAGLIPPEALKVHLETFQRIAKDMGYRDTLRKVNRLAAEYAHQVVLFDASTSAYFSVVRELDDGDFLLKLNPRPHPDYKNKPVGKERLRLVVYSFWEMFSGYQWGKYIPAQGENGFDAMDSFVAFCEPKADPRDPVQGLPEQLWVDQGPIAKLGASLDLLNRLGVEIVKGTPYEKERMGGVERTHRTRWQFESGFYMWLSNVPALTAEGLPLPLTPYQKGEFLLSELNARCACHRERINANHTRWDLKKTKLQVWQLSAAERSRNNNPIRRIPENAIETMATEVRRRVNQDGVFQWNNEFYEVDDGLHSRWVMARRSLGNPEKIIVEDIETGKRFTTKLFKPRTLGEYRAFPKSVVDKAKELGAGLSVAPPYANTPLNERGEGGISSNVVSFPAKTAAPAFLPNPLEASKYDTMGEALRAFMDHHGMPTFAYEFPDEFEMARSLIEQHGLAKDYVRTLALELREAIKVKSQ